VPRSYPTSESHHPHPTNVIKGKHSRLALRIPSPDERLLVVFQAPQLRGKGTVPSSISFRFKSYDFVPCLDLLMVILLVLEVILPSLSGKICESRERYISLVGYERGMMAENLGSEEEYHPIADRPFNF
jgi:hypothetical protein